MKYKFIVIFIVVFCFLSSSSVLASDNITPDEAVTIMHEYGFFKGTENGFELDRIPTRLEAVIMAVRITGSETWALTENWDNSDLYAPHSFSDVPDWASGYVSCAVNYQFLVKDFKLINGISATEFGSDLPITAEQYVTILLRALDYQDSYGNFSWDNPWELSDHIGLTDGSYPDCENFTRRDMVYLSYKALKTNTKNSSCNMYYNLFVYQHPPDTVFPEVFQSNNDNILMHRSSNYRSIQIGEIAYGSFAYDGVDKRIMDIEVIDPSILRIDAIENQLDNYGGGTSVTYTALAPGKTCIKATYADDYGEPYAIAFINVVVLEAEVAD